MLKSELVAHCLRILEEKIAAIQGDLDELADAVRSESKSSAGDKHETARAMMNIEQEKLGRQLSELLQMKDNFLKLDFNKVTEIVSSGSLITTDRGMFLLSIPLGKVVFEKDEYILLSPQSPLGESMLTKRKGDTVSINGKIFRLLMIDGV